MVARVKFEISADEYARLATAQVDALRQAADAIAAGTLDGIRRDWLPYVAAAVRAFADQIPTTPPRGRAAAVPAALTTVWRRSASPC